MQTVVSETEDELIDAFMEAYSAAEVDPTEEILRSLQHICASLSRSPANAWGQGSHTPSATGRSVLGDDPVAETDRAGAVFDAEHGGLEEDTGIAEEQLPATAYRVRNLVKEAKVYIQLSLFDLAEGAVSKALILFEQQRTQINEDEQDEDDDDWMLEPITGVLRLRDLREDALLHLLEQASECESPTRIRLVDDSGGVVELNAIHGMVCFGFAIDGDLYTDEPFQEARAAAETAACSDTSPNDLEDPPFELHEASRRLTARGLLLAADLMTRGYRIEAESIDPDDCSPLRFSPLSLRIATAALSDEVHDPAAQEFYQRFVGESRFSWLIREGQGERYAVNAHPGDELPLESWPIMLGCANTFRASARALHEDWNVLWIAATDGFWLVATTPKSLVLHRYLGRSMGRIMSLLATFSPADSGRS